MRPESPIDVCSHKRSGTHFLMATIWHNFVLLDVTVTGMVRAGQSYVNENGERTESGYMAKVTWGGLWRTHGPFDRSFDVSKTVYMIRNPFDTLMSFWRFCDPLMNNEPDEYIGRRAVLRWYKQSAGYLKSGCTIVRYEDLASDNHDDVLRMLELKHGLKRKRSKFERYEKYIGWYPSEEPIQTNILPDMLIDAVEKIIPRGFFGYLL